MAGRIGMAIVVSLRSGARRHRPERAAGGMELGALTAGVSRDKLNLLVVTLETTRADRLGAYGAEQIRTPVFDRLAREGRHRQSARFRRRGAAPANEVVERALPWLEQHKDQRFFAWLHFYDAHTPYDPPEPFKSEYGGWPYNGEIAFVDSLCPASRRSMITPAATIRALAVRHTEDMSVTFPPPEMVHA